MVREKKADHEKGPYGNRHVDALDELDFESVNDVADGYFGGVRSWGCTDTSQGEKPE